MVDSAKKGPNMMLIGGVVLFILVVVGWLLFGLSAGGVIAKDTPAPPPPTPTVVTPPPPPVSAPPPPPPSAAYTKQPQTGDWWGNELGNFPTSDPNECAKKCDANSSCVAFVTASDSQNCWLKSKLDPAMNHPGSASVRQYYTKSGVVFPPR